MQATAQATPPKVVHMIPAKIDLQEEVKRARKQLRVAAYCRVSTKQEDQLNSYDVQRRAYTDKINGEPGWTMVGIYADRASQAQVSRSEMTSTSSCATASKARST